MLLDELAKKYGTDKGIWGYLPHYARELDHRRNAITNVLEIGICGGRDIPNNVTGASLWMWHDYFPQARVHGIDNDPRWMVQADRITSYLGDQRDPKSMRTIAEHAGPFDLIVDDAIHDPDIQVGALRALLPYLKPDGLYVIEDVCLNKLPNNDITQMLRHFPPGYACEVIRTHKAEVLLFIKKADAARREHEGDVAEPRRIRYVFDPASGSRGIVGFPAVVLDYPAEGTPHIVPGFYERPLVDWAMELAPSHKQFVDIGAHMGSWTLVMATHFREVHAFEPQRLVFQQLCGNVALNGLTNVHAYKVGLDNLPGTLRLHRPGVDRGSSSVRVDVRERLAIEHADITPEAINVIRLDTLADLLTDVGLMKIDVEGLELRVLQGAVDVLRRNNLPKLLLECWSHDWYARDKAALLNWLDAFGYRVVPISHYPDMILAEKK